MPVSIPLLRLQGTPDDGVSEVQRLTPSGTISGGSFTITYSGQETDPIDWDATAAEIQAALEALSNIAVGDVVCAGGPINSAFVSITFAGSLAGLAVSEVTVDDALLTGTDPVITPSTTTAGVLGTYRGAQPGALLADELNGILLVNSGTALVPVWTDLTEDQV